MVVPQDSRRVSVLLGVLFGLAGMGSSSAVLVPVLRSVPVVNASR